MPTHLTPRPSNGRRAAHGRGAASRPSPARWDDLTFAEASRQIRAMIRLGRGHELCRERPGAWEWEDGE